MAMAMEAHVHLNVLPWEVMGSLGNLASKAAFEVTHALLVVNKAKDMLEGNELKAFQVQWASMEAFEEGKVF